MFLARCMVARTGADEQHAIEDCVAFIHVLVSMNRVMAEQFDLMERDAKVQEVAGQGVPRTMIADRMGVSRKTIFEAVKRHQEAHRRGLRAVG
jgi:hypothetical protein